MNLLRKRFIIAGIFLMNGVPILTAQHHDHSHSGHRDPVHLKNEIGVANNLIYLGEDKDLAYGLHFHYMRSIGESHFGYGLGYEQIFDEHLHRSMMVIGSFTPIPHLNFNVAPGITFIGKEQPERTFAMHLEANYEIELGHFHLGPALEYAISGHGFHLSLGLHLAYAF